MVAGVVLLSRLVDTEYCRNVFEASASKHYIRQSLWDELRRVSHCPHQLVSLLVLIAREIFLSAWLNIQNGLFFGNISHQNLSSYYPSCLSPFLQNVTLTNRWGITPHGITASGHNRQKFLLLTHHLQGQAIQRSQHRHSETGSQNSKMADAEGGSLIEQLDYELMG